MNVQSRGSFDRLLGSSQACPPGVVKPAVTLHLVSQSWGDRVVLGNVSATFVTPSLYVVMGPSGSGKSTLLNIVAGYLRPDSGVVNVSGSVGYVLQEDMLFSKLTIAENMEVAWGCHDVTPNAALKDGFLRVVGLDQKLRQPVAELSGGERKRLQVAMTLVDKPDILLMDEPSAALDSRNKELLAGLLTESFADTCLIMATHDWELVEMLASPSLVAIREGRLQFD